MRAGRARLMLVVGLLGCVRWEPLASAELAASGSALALERVRVSGAEGARELTLRRVRAGALEGWDREGRPVRHDLAALRQVWRRRPDELLTAGLVAGIYALVFTVSALGLFIDRP